MSSPKPIAHDATDEKITNEQPEPTLPAIRAKVRSADLLADAQRLMKAAETHARVVDSNRVFLRHHGFGGKR